MPKRKKESLGSEVYTGVADFGVIIADLKAIGGLIIGLILVGVGIYLLVQKITRTLTIQGVVINPSCSFNINSSNSKSGTTTNTYWDCTFSVKYTVNGKDYTLQSQETKGGINYQASSTPQNIKVWYNPDDPNDASISDDYSHTVGWILIVIGLIIAISGIIWAWLANRYKIIGAYEGARTGIGMVTGRY